MTEVRHAVVDLWKDRNPLDPPLQLAQNLQVRQQPTLEQIHAQNLWVEVESVLKVLQGQPKPEPVGGGR
jgi:hypothetical protein